MNSHGIGPAELLLIVVLALIVLGPEKLPEVMAQVGKAISEFRRAIAQLIDVGLLTAGSHGRALNGKARCAPGDY